jgi:hypothetical protein
MVSLLLRQSWWGEWLSADVVPGCIDVRILRSREGSLSRSPRWNICPELSLAFSNPIVERLPVIGPERLNRCSVVHSPPPLHFSMWEDKHASICLLLDGLSKPSQRSHFREHWKRLVALKGSMMSQSDGSMVAVMLVPLGNAPTLRRVTFPLTP